MPFVTDQMGRRVEIPACPGRIISLVPSQTELLFDLGIDSRIAGITKFCIHPSLKIKSLPRIGGTKQLDLDLIRALNPDLIIGNKEENEKLQVEILFKEFPVWMSDVVSLNDAFEMIAGIGSIVNKQDEANAIVKTISESFIKLKSCISRQGKNLQRVAYFIWRKPYMVAAKHTFINEVLECCGLENCFSEGRYPVIQLEELERAAPDLIFLSSEPYPFKEKNIAEFRSVCPNAKILLVDGEMFSWYGSRLQYSAAYLRSLIQNI